MASNNAGVSVSVIIPALNEERVIGQCLRALASQDFPRDRFEVVVVDNGSTDRTVETARSLSAEMILIVLAKPGVRISALRNFGVSKARGQVLAFLDADCIPPAHWLRTAVALLEKQGAGAVGAHYKIPDGSSWVARAWFGGMELEKQGDIAWVPAGDMILPRSTFERVGGFDESIQTNEDCELCERIRASGLRVVGDAAVAVIHLGTPQTLSHFYRKIRWHASDGLRVFLKSLPRVTNPRPLLFASYTLICLAGVAAGCAAAALGKSFAVLAWSLAALLAPALLLSLRLVIKRKKWSDLGALTVLHLAFGLARGHALLRAPGSVRRG